MMALVSIQLSTGPLLAKPTRPLARPAARKLIVAQPAARSSRDRVAHPRILAHSRAHSGPPSRAASIPATSRLTRSKSRSGQISRETATLHSSAHLRGRPRTPAQERAFAAQAAITSADRGHRDDSRAERADTRTSRQRRLSVPIENATRNSLPRLRPSGPSQLSSDDAAAGEESAAPSSAVSQPSLVIGSTNTSALINVGGILRPAPGSIRLKSIEEEAVTPVLLPGLRVSSLYDSHGRLVVPPPLYGSREILLHQNEMADRDGLIRVHDDADLLDLRREKKLVALPDNETLRVDFRLPENRRYSRPWTAAFLTIIARDYYDSFHTPLQVDSAVRTIAVQQRLIRTNGNAAPSTGDTASPHLTGQAIDIAKGGLSRTQIAWMRTYLQPLIDLGKIDVEEEFHQSCFHISVYKNFVPAISPRVSIAAARQLSPANLQESPAE
jgi:hypothetical protein